MASAALFSWPLIALSLFAGMGLVRGLIVSTIVGYLFLPSSFAIDPPVLPAYDKTTAISFGMLLGVALFRNREPAAMREVKSGDRLFSAVLLALLAAYLLTPVGIYLTNREPQVFGPTVLPGLGPWDVVSMSWDSVIFLVPFLLARRYLRTPESWRQLLVFLVLAGLVYSVAVLFERRMSPQLHNWVYGFHQHRFAQHIRNGGFRAMVFLTHGLEVGLFLLSVVLAAFTLYRGRALQKHPAFLLAGAWMFLVLLLSRNLGASLLAVLFVPIILFLTLRTQVRLAVAVSIIFLLYPAVRQYDLLPIDRFVRFVESISIERAQSFGVRLDNEADLLKRAREKPLFGWGGYGRNRIFDENGRSSSITDGYWIQVLGMRGWIGYVAFFGLLTLPVIWVEIARRRKELTPVTAGMAIILAANFIDMVPNSTISPVNLLILGSVAAFVQFDSVLSSDAAEEGRGAQKRRGIRYTRFDGRSPPARRAGRA